MKKITSILILLQICHITLAQKVKIDPDFGTSGIVVTHNINTYGIVKTKVLPDGKILNTGVYKQGGGSQIYHLLLARYNEDGSLDKAFGTGGLVKTPIGYSEMPYAMLIQPDNKILVGGSMYLGPGPNGPGEDRSFVARYNPDGTLDASFGQDGILIVNIYNVDNAVTNMALLPDGKILAAGSHASVTHNTMLVRLNQDGSYDNSFGSEGCLFYNGENAHFSLWDMRVLDDGSILSCGVDGRDPYNRKSKVVKLHADGTYDNSFGHGGNMTIDIDTIRAIGVFDRLEYFSKLIVLPNGKILLGAFSDAAGRKFFIQLLPHGELDPSFGNDGFLHVDGGYNDFILQNNDQILMFSQFAPKIFISRFNADGSLDSTFNTNGVFIYEGQEGSNLSNIELQNDNNILLTGSREINRNYLFAMTRFIFYIPSPKTGNVLLYPNPFHDKVFISTSTEDIDQVIIHDISGRRIKKISGSAITSFTLTASAGVYGCTLISSKGDIWHRQLVKY